MDRQQQPVGTLMAIHRDLLNLHFISIIHYRVPTIFTSVGN